MSPSDLKQRLADLPDTAREAVADALEEIAAGVVDEARHSLGRVSPSAPGGPPADPYGSIAASLTASVDREVPRATISANSPHARFLEYGTRRMAARPFLRTAIAAMGEEARDRLKTALARAVASLGDTL